MQRFSITLIALSILTIGSNAVLHADGLIKTLPEDGTWASYAVETTITHKDGSQTSSTGTLTVRSVGTTEIDGTVCRWIEFEHSWEQAVTEKISRGFHSSITKIAIPESAFSKNADPTKEIRAGYSAKTSAKERPDKWDYPRVGKVEPGRGSATGYGAIDHYVRAPFGHPVQLADKTFKVGDRTLICSGLEQSETTHKLGADRRSVTSTAFRQWRNDETPFGTVGYHFERLQMNGVSFNQKLELKSIGNDAKTSLANVN